MAMDFGKRLVAFRKQQNLTQAQLADLVGVHIAQLRNYEANRSQPTLDVIRKLSIALKLSADDLIFDPHERLPILSDPDLIKAWELLHLLPPDQRLIIKSICEAFICRHSFLSLQNKL
jgi:transcriptional regulator with XRE-family HTH domain